MNITYMEHLWCLSLYLLRIRDFSYNPIVRMGCFDHQSYLIGRGEGILRVYLGGFNPSKKYANVKLGIFFRDRVENKKPRPRKMLDPIGICCLQPPKMKDFLWVPIGTVGAFAGMRIMGVQSARSLSTSKTLNLSCFARLANLANSDSTFVGFPLAQYGVISLWRY